MHTTHLLTISHSIPCVLGGSTKPLRCRSPWRQTPLEIDPPGGSPNWRQTPWMQTPVVVWPVMHACWEANPPASVDRRNDRRPWKHYLVSKIVDANRRPIAFSLELTISMHWCVVASKQELVQMLTTFFSCFENCWECCLGFEIQLSNFKHKRDFWIQLYNNCFNLDLSQPRLWYLPRLLPLLVLCFSGNCLMV